MIINDFIESTDNEGNAEKEKHQKRLGEKLDEYNSNLGLRLLLWIDVSLMLVLSTTKIKRTDFIMENHTYKLIEITGTSEESMEGAVENAIARASKTVNDMRWFKVTETRGVISGDGVTQWQVTLKIGFTLDI